MASQTAQAARGTFIARFTGSIKRKQAGQARKATPLSSAKLADRPAAAAAPAADAWSIQAVQRCGSVCTDAAHQAECMDMTAYPAAPASPASEGSAGPSTAAASPLPILDLEITAEEAQWLVQPHAQTESPAPVTSPTQAPEQPTPAACTTTTAAAATTRPAAALLAALRRGLRRLAGGLRRRLAAAACMARPVTLECGGCPGRRLGNASSGASAEWTVTHVNWI